MTDDAHWSWLHQATLSETCVRRAGDDEVIVDRDAHELAGLDELAGDPDVFARWLRVAWGRDRARCLP